MVLGALDGVKEAVAVVGDALESVVDAVVLPRVLNHQHLQQQVQVGAQLVGVGVGHLFVRVQTTLCAGYENSRKGLDSMLIIPIFLTVCVQGMKTAEKALIPLSLLFQSS